MIKILVFSLNPWPWPWVDSMLKKEEEEEEEERVLQQYSCNTIGKNISRKENKILE